MFGSPTPDFSWKRTVSASQLTSRPARLRCTFIRNRVVISSVYMGTDIVRGFFKH